MNRVELLQRYNRMNIEADGGGKVTGNTVIPLSRHLYLILLKLSQQGVQGVSYGNSIHLLMKKYSTLCGQ